tara:strand:- start:402 stop:542 length:141 start_codon:yes stop_codon:yes gene_type:complete
MFISEALIAKFQFNFPINYENFGWLFITLIVAFFPSLILFNKIDKL